MSWYSSHVLVKNLPPLYTLYLLLSLTYDRYKTIDLTDYSLLPNGLVFVQNTYSSFLRNTTKYNFVIGCSINKKQFRVGEYWNVNFICTRHDKLV